MALPRSNFSSSQRLIRDQQGFAYVFFLSFLPVLLAGFLLILFSQFYLKNWMESLHICRVELLSAQKKTARHLEELMKLNSLAKALRWALEQAEVKLELAITTENPALAAEASRQIASIKKQQRELDSQQKSLILQSNLEMDRGTSQVLRKIRQQSQELQSKLPEYFRFKIYNIQARPQVLAVQPDRPDVAPVYELKTPFKEQQALHVSWISEFETRSPERYKWLLNHHKKYDGCSASLSEDHQKFQEILIEDKSSLKL